MSARYLTAAALRNTAAQLTERDLAVLKRVSGLRFASGSQLTRMHFAEGPDSVASARAARRALLRLTRLDVLARLPRVVGGVRSGSAGFIYHLGRVGQRLAVERGWQPERRTRRSHVPGTLFLNHALQVAELHTLLVEAERADQVELLTLEAEPACHRPSGGFTLKPDSYARLGVGDYEDSYFIEVDMGTEGSRALERQLKLYLDYEASGVEKAARGVFPKTLWLAPDTRRASVISECIAHLPEQARELFAVALFTDALQLITNTTNECLTVTHTENGDRGIRYTYE